MSRIFFYYTALWLCFSLNAIELAFQNWSGYIATPSFITTVTGQVSAVFGTWTVPQLMPPTGNNPIAYKIYRDAALTQLIATVSGNTFEYDDHSRNPNGTYSYYIVAIGSNGEPSYTASITVAPGNRCVSAPAGSSTDGATNVQGYARQDIFLTQIDNYNHLTWSAPDLETTYVSLWVGIDGFNSPTIEQIGTEHRWVNGQQVDFGWFEMFPAPFFELSQSVFPVQAGDSISALVEYIGEVGDGISQFQLSMANNTQGISVTIAPSLTRGPADRSCAEWIAEAPTSADLEIQPLANFGTVYFTNCGADIGSVIDGPINDPSWQNARTTMRRSYIIKASPSELMQAGQDFTVTWLHD